MQEILSKKLATMSSSVRKIFQNCNSERTDPSEGSALNKREFQTLLDKCNVQVSFTISFRCAGLCAASSNLRSLHHATVLPSAIDFVYLAPLPRRIALHRFHFISFHSDEQGRVREAFCDGRPRRQWHYKLSGIQRNFR